MNHENKTLKFKTKTNNNCGECVAQVEHILNDAEGICHWDVDMDNQQEVLSVHANGITGEEVIPPVAAGFKIQLFNQYNY